MRRRSQARKSGASRSLVVDCKNSLEIFLLVLCEHFLLIPADEEEYVSTLLENISTNNSKIPVT